MNPIELQKALGGMEYPASRNELVKHAQGKSADEEALSALKDLPYKKYETPTDVNKEVS